MVTPISSMLSVGKAVPTLKLFTHETVMNQRFVVVEPLLTAFRTVIRGDNLTRVFILPITSMEISKAFLAVWFFIFDAKPLCIDDFTGSTINILWFPFFRFC